MAQRKLFSDARLLKHIYKAKSDCRCSLNQFRHIVILTTTHQGLFQILPEIG